MATTRQLLTALHPGRYDAARRERDIPKSRRRSMPVRPVPALGDPLAALGHPPRPRKARRRG